jgi:hypothetical protein
MHDEWSDATGPLDPRPNLSPATRQDARRTTQVARLVCRLYGAATPALRSRLLACLVRPLGTLGMAGVAAGAFGVLLYRREAQGVQAALDDVARFSNDQIVELVRFVEQVSPDALQEFARLFFEAPFGMAAFSASAALLLMRALHQQDGKGLGEVFGLAERSGA